MQNVKQEFFVNLGKIQSSKYITVFTCNCRRLISNDDKHFSNFLLKHHFYKYLGKLSSNLKGYLWQDNRSSLSNRPLIENVHIFIKLCFMSWHQIYLIVTANWAETLWYIIFENVKMSHLCDIWYHKNDKKFDIHNLANCL